MRVQNGSNDASRGVRVSGDEVRAHLDKLDENSRPPDAANRRGLERFSYRVSSLVVEFEQVGGQWQRLAVPTRNLSSRGISFLIGHFVYPGTRCRVQLLSLHNHRVTTSGKVQRCRYLPGTGSIHEVGVQFDSVIDIGLFHRNAMDTRMLVVDDDDATRSIVARLLAELNVELTFAGDGKGALEAVQKGAFDLMLLDIELPELDGFEVMKQMQERGDDVPVVGVSADDTPERRNQALQSGFSFWLGKPISKTSLISTVRALRDEPLISAHMHDPTMTVLIDEFVASIDKRLRLVEEASGGQDELDFLRRLRSFKGESGTCGFEIIAQAVQEAIDAVVSKQPRDVVRKQLSRMKRLARSARPVTGRRDTAAHVASKGGAAADHAAAKSASTRG